MALVLATEVKATGVLLVAAADSAIEVGCNILFVFAYGVMLNIGGDPRTVLEGFEAVTVGMLERLRFRLVIANAVVPTSLVRLPLSLALTLAAYPAFSIGSSVLRWNIFHACGRSFLH